MTEAARPKVVEFQSVGDAATAAVRRMFDEAPVAERGMTAAAYIAVNADGTVSSHYISAPGTEFSLLGAAADLQHRIQTELIEQE